MTLIVGCDVDLAVESVSYPKSGKFNGKTNNLGFSGNIHYMVTS